MNEARRRLFFALWPDESVQARLSGLQSALAVSGRAVPSVDLHLTLAFVGNADFSQAAALRAMARRLQSRPLRMSIDRFGSFPKAGIVWAGMHQVCPELSRLASKLRQGVRDCALSIDDKAFRPHVSLYRNVKPVPSDFPAVPPLAWLCQSFVLAESSGLADEPYRIVERFKTDEL